MTILLRHPPNIEIETVPPWIPQIPTCQIDASWIDNDSINGLGWSLKDQMGSEYFGLRACSRSLSALHAGLANIHVRARDVPEITGGFRGCECVPYSSE